jgi:hypothetical protein
MATPRTGRPRGRPKKPLPPDDDRMPDLPPQAWACLEVEFGYGWMGEASLERIKQRTGLGRESIRRWRLKPLYKRGFGWLLAEWMKRRDAEAENAAFDLAREIEARVRARMPEWVAARWAGAIRSMANGAIYTSAAAYTAHLLEANKLPVELFDEVRAELTAEAREIRLSA